MNQDAPNAYTDYHPSAPSLPEPLRAAQALTVASNRHMRRAIRGAIKRAKRQTHRQELRRRTSNKQEKGA